MTDPTLLRRAIESVGIEKPSDYTLVLEEVERLMDERLVEKVYRAANDAAEQVDEHATEKMVKAAIETTGILALIRAATDLVQEMEEMGYGKTSDRALPGSYDNLLAALAEVKK